MSHVPDGHGRNLVPDSGANGPAWLAPSEWASGCSPAGGHVRNLVPDMSGGAR